MERQHKAIMDGVIKSDVKAEESERRWRVCWSFDMLLRMLGLALTVVASVVAGVDEETEIVIITVVDGLPPLRIPATAKWNYMSATVYFVVANAIACSYSAVSLVLSMVCGSSKSSTKMALLVSDLMMVALLFSANGAAAAVGIIALNGNPHVQWHKVCYLFKTYCRNGAASIVMSMLGSFVFLWLVVLATLNLHRKNVR